MVCWLIEKAARHMKGHMSVVNTVLVCCATLCCAVQMYSLDGVRLPDVKRVPSSSHEGVATFCDNHRTTKNAGTGGQLQLLDVTAMKIKALGARSTFVWLEQVIIECPCALVTFAAELAGTEM